MDNDILKANVFAKAAHAAVGQLRKYTNEPYIVHPVEVARIVMRFEHDASMLAAALLHDVVEDTQVSLTLIREVFGADVAELVGWLTKFTTPADGNRAVRSAMERDRLAKAPARAQTIKVADLISNTSSIVQHDPKFAVVYLAEKKDLLEVLTAADPDIRRVAFDMLRHAYTQLEITKG